MSWITSRANRVQGNILLIALVCALITSYYIYRHLEHSHIIPHNLTSCKIIFLCG